MIRDRSYAQGRTVGEAIEELERHRGTQFDPNLIGVFLQLLRGERAVGKASR
jgi:HD-GYP domain-containing protein (c-di-GMP phosphodiesterase class II)